MSTEKRGVVRQRHQRAGQTGELTVPGQYTILAPNINQLAAEEAEKVWEYTTKIGGRGRSESDVCMRNWLSGMVSAALGQFPCPTRKYIALPAKCIGKARTSTSK